MAASSPVKHFQEKVFPAAGISLHYAEGPPTGPPLVLLHGLARDWKSFSVLLPDLSLRYHIFALDLRGHGASSRSPHGYRISQYAQDVSEFLQALIPAGAAIFGHSLGGGVGMCLAANAMCHVSALIVGDSTISPATFARSMYQPMFRQLRDLILRASTQHELALGIAEIEIQIPGLRESLRIGDLPGNSKVVLMEWARCALQTDPDALAMTLDASSFEGWHPTQFLPRISCPTLLLQGNPELDGLLSDDDVQIARKLLAHSEIVKFPLLGHALFMQQAKPVLQAVTAFLEKHVPNPRA